MLFWDLDARNHEITTLKIGNIRLRERYAEGEIPHNTKTGGGPILLTFPYVRDWPSWPKNSITKSDDTSKLSPPTSSALLQYSFHLYIIHPAAQMLELVEEKSAPD